MITQERLKELLNYDSDTGIFTWRLSTNNKIKIGAIAGCITPKGYIRIRLDGIQYSAHVLAWLYVNGKYPENEIDHISTIKHQNWISNLRDSTRKENSYNQRLTVRNKSGFKGVSWYKPLNKWRAAGAINGVFKHLGYFDDVEEAAKAYSNFAKPHHGEFYREN